VATSFAPSKRRGGGTGSAKAAKPAAIEPRRLRASVRLVRLWPPGLSTLAVFYVAAPAHRRALVTPTDCPMSLERTEKLS
jgi:hypothetical protein